MCQLEASTFLHAHVVGRTVFVRAHTGMDSFSVNIHSLTHPLVPTCPWLILG